MNSQSSINSIAPFETLISLAGYILAAVYFSRSFSSVALEIQIIIDCKDYNRPVDVKGVEEFDGLLRDVGAQKGVLVCPKGFTETAKARAAGLQIDLYSPVDTDAHKWQASVTIPALCDFRSAAMSFALSTTAPAPFKLFDEFYSKHIIFDSEGKPLGTALAAT
jgi:hypothetical protein